MSEGAGNLVKREYKLYEFSGLEDLLVLDTSFDLIGRGRIRPRSSFVNLQDLFRDVLQQLVSQAITPVMNTSTHVMVSTEEDK
jgi:hypothetical protein